MQNRFLTSKIGEGIVWLIDGSELRRFENRAAKVSRGANFERGGDDRGWQPIPRKVHLYCRDEAVLMPSGTRLTVINGNSLAHLYRYYAIVNTFARWLIRGVSFASRRRRWPLDYIMHYTLDRVSNSYRFENSFYHLIPLIPLLLLEYCETRYLYLIYIYYGGRIFLMNSRDTHIYIYIYTRVTNDRLVLLLECTCATLCWHLG